MHMDRLLPVCVLYFALSVLTVSTWPMSLQEQEDDPDYLNNLRQTWNSQEDGGEPQTQPDSEEQYDSDLLPPSWRLEEFQRNFQDSLTTLPRATFSELPDDITNNGGAGPFKFVKPASPQVVVKTRSGPTLKTLKVHVPTISDETPLYLNYAKQDDTSSHQPPALTKNTELNNATKAGLLDQLQQEKLESIMADDRWSEPSDSSEETGNSQEQIPLMMYLPEETENEEKEDIPEIDFTQRLTFPDLSGPEADDVRPESEVATYEAENDKAVPYEIEEPAEESPAENDLAEAVDSSSPTDAPVPAEATTSPDLELVHVVAPVIQPQHLGMQPDIHFIPAHEYDFLLKNTADKRTVSQEGTQTAGSSLIVLIGVGLVGAVSVACVGAAIFYRRSKRKPRSMDGEEDPSYGVTGPPVKPNFLDLSGDRSLAKSAETYHYQEQKKKILSSVDNNPSSGGSTATPKSGDHSDYDTEDDDEDGEDYGDYTVYECPGLAPPGEIEVLNPMFSGNSSKDESSPQ